MKYKTQSKAKRLDFELTQAVLTKSATSGTDCVIEGYANTMSKDRVGDVVYPKAFEKTLPTYLKNPVLLANHDWNDPVGVVQHAEITDKGLFIRARVSDTREDIKTLIREKCLRTFSIGYNELDADYDEETKTKYVKELELLEISIVTVPANTEASFTMIEEKKEEPKTEAKPEEGKEAKVERQEGESLADCVSRAIPKLINEGMDQDQAAAAAYSMCGEKSHGKCSCTKEKAADPQTQITQLCDFIVEIRKTMSNDLTVKQIVAICEQFKQEENEMNRKELIEILRGKSSAAPTDGNPAPTADPGKKEEGQPAEGEQNPMDAMYKEMMAKLDAIAQALAQILEGDSKNEEEKPKDEEKPEENQEDDEEKSEQPAPTDEEKSVDEEVKDLDSEIAALDAEIAAIEDSENL